MERRGDPFHLGRGILNGSGLIEPGAEVRPSIARPPCGGPAAATELYLLHRRMICYQGLRNWSKLAQDGAKFLQRYSSEATGEGGAGGELFGSVSLMLVEAYFKQGEWETARDKATEVS